jgi:SAM-dependent methyltransferase
MRFRATVERYRWSLLIVAAAVGAWYLAFNYLTEFRSPDVPFVPTPSDVVAAMLDLAAVTSADTVYDLGSGDGRIVIAAARDRGAHAVGIEIDPKLAEQASLAVRGAGLADKAEIWRGDMFRFDFTPATVVTFYLTPPVISQLRPKLERLRPGTRVVSHMYLIPGAKPDNIVNVKSAESALEHRVYLWVAPIHWDGD